MKKTFLYLIGRHQRAFLIALLWGVGYALVMTLINPLAIKLLFDEAVIKKNFEVFVWVAVGSLVLFTGLRYIDYAYRLYKQRLSNRMLLDLALKVTRLYFRVPYQRIQEKGEGYFVSRTYDEVQSSVQPSLDTVLGLFRSSATLMGGMVTIMLISWKLTLIMLAITPFMLLMSRRYAGKIHQNTRAEQEKSADLREVNTSLLQAYKTVRMFRLAPLALGQYQSRFDQYLRANYTRIQNMSLYSTLSGLFLSIMEMLVILAGGYSIMTSSLTFGGLMAFMNAYWLAVNALQSLIDSIPRISIIQATVERLQEFEQQAEPETAPSSGVQDIDLNGVQFAYGQQVVLRDVNLHIPPGQRILIEGPNGAGKSTLAHLLSGLLKPLVGTISLPDEISALVEPVHFPTLTLRELFSVYPEHLTAPLIEKLGLNPLLEQTYTELSLGQKKKVNVLMCVLKEADCYILDEPLANVDQQTQPELLEAILEYTSGKTLLVILHGAGPLRSHFDAVMQVQGRVTLGPASPPVAL